MAGERAVNFDFAVRVELLDARRDAIGFEVTALVLEHVEDFVQDAEVLRKALFEIFQRDRAFGVPVEATVKLR